MNLEAEKNIWLVSVSVIQDIEERVTSSDTSLDAVNLICSLNNMILDSTELMESILIECGGQFPIHQYLQLLILNEELPLDDERNRVVRKIITSIIASKNESTGLWLPKMFDSFTCFISHGLIDVSLVKKIIPMLEEKMLLIFVHVISEQLVNWEISDAYEVISCILLMETTINFQNDVSSIFHRKASLIMVDILRYGITSDFKALLQTIKCLLENEPKFNLCLFLEESDPINLNNSTISAVRDLLLDMNIQTVIFSDSSIEFGKWYKINDRGLLKDIVSAIQSNRNGLSINITLAYEILSHLIDFSNAKIISLWDGQSDLLLPFGKYSKDHEAVISDYIAKLYRKIKMTSIIEEMQYLI